MRNALGWQTRCELSRIQANSETGLVPFVTCKIPPGWRQDSPRQLAVKPVMPIESSRWLRDPGQAWQKTSPGFIREIQPGRTRIWEQVRLITVSESPRMPNQQHIFFHLHTLVEVQLVLCTPIYRGRYFPGLKNDPDLPKSTS